MTFCVVQQASAIVIELQSKRLVNFLNDRSLGEQGQIPSASENGLHRRSRVFVESVMLIIRLHCASYGDENGKYDQDAQDGSHVERLFSNEKAVL